MGDTNNSLPNGEVNGNNGANISLNGNGGLDGQNNAAGGALGGAMGGAMGDAMGGAIGGATGSATGGDNGKSNNGLEKQDGNDKRPSAGVNSLADEEVNNRPNNNGGLNGLNNRPSERIFSKDGNIPGSGIDNENNRPSERGFYSRDDNITRSEHNHEYNRPRERGFNYRDDNFPRSGYNNEYNRSSERGFNNREDYTTRSGYNNDYNRPNERVFNNRDDHISRSGFYNDYNRPNERGFNSKDDDILRSGANNEYYRPNERGFYSRDDDILRSGFNNDYNRSNGRGYNNKDGDIPRSGFNNDYNRPNDREFLYRDDNITRGAYNSRMLNPEQTRPNNNPLNNDYPGGARPKDFSDQQNKRPSFFEDMSRQRQGFFEENRHRQSDYMDRNRAQRFEQEGKNTVPIPLLNEYKEFETWYACVLAWSATTELPLYKQGYFLANELPKESSKYGNNLRDDLYRVCPPNNLINNVNGIEVVVKFIKTRFYVDEEKQIFEIKREMSNIQRRPGQNIHDFLIEFENLREKSKALGIEIQNDRLLALTLFECAKLDTTEETVVRGVCQFMLKDGKRYETVKRKLAEVCSRLNEKQNNNENIFLTQSLGNSNREDDIQNSIDQVYLSNGWLPPRNGRYQNSGNRNNGTQNSQARNGPKFSYRTKSKNPLDKNGKVMLCLICGADTHLVRFCPDSFENRKRSAKNGYDKKKKYKPVFLMNHETGEEKEILAEFTDSESEKDTKESVHCTVLCSDNKEEMSNFTAEALNMAALDTCCTSSVAGEEWLRIYRQSLPENMKQKIQGPIESSKQFVLGNQGKLKSKAKYIIPVKIGGCENEITLDIINSDIPLLLSKGEMKRLGITLDMKNDTGTINGKPLVLTTTSAGHYIVDLLQENEKLDSVNVTELDIDNDSEQMKALKKIHLQFGHRPKKIFVTILKEAGKWKEKFSGMIDKIMGKCEGCLLRRRVPDKPAVAPPLASDFGQVLTIDLKVWDKNKGIYIMYMIDMFTRFQVASVIRSKEPAEIVKTLLLKWMPIFGRVEKILTDNGTEFCNEEMREVASAFNIQLLTTGAHAPYQNGTNEKAHGLTDGIVRSNLRDYPKMSLEVALAWAVSAVNSLTNVRGFSPYQLVFGRQIKLPNILDDPPPAWEEPTKSQSLLDTLEALHKSRTEYIKAERSERIRKALKAKIRVADTIYENGDIVYFRKEGEDVWKGPAKVVFQDSKVIFIRLGSIYYRVSANRLLKAGNELVKELEKKDDKQEEVTHKSMNDKESEKVEERTHTTRSRQQLLDQELSEQEPTRTQRQTSNDPYVSNEDISEQTNDYQTEVQGIQQETNPVKERSRDKTTDNDDDIIMEDVQTTPQVDITPQVDNLPQESNKDTETDSTKDKDRGEMASESNNIPLRNSRGRKRRQASQKPTPSFNEDGTLQNAKHVLKRNDRIEIFEKGKWEKGKILSHGGKVGGRNAGWFNIELDNGEVFHDEVSKRDIRYEGSNENTIEEEEVLTVIKLDNGRNLEIQNIDERKIRVESEEETAFLMICEEILAVMVPKEKRNSPECEQAKFEELNKLKAFDTYEIVDDEGQDRITTTWVLTEKGSEIRARLTARGFQEETDFPTDSPTVQKQSIRLISVLAATNKWTIHTTDISSAFLQGSQMDRDVFVKPPKEAGLMDKLWKLHKCLYGLKDASRKWYMRILAKLKELGFKKSPLDKGLFYLIKDGELIGLIGIHVDDFFYAGTKEFLEEIMPQVLGIFKVGKSEAKQFMYTGFYFKQDNEGVTVDQDKYIDQASLPEIDVKQIKDKQREMSQDELTLLRQITGVLNWTVRATRPDLAFDCVDLSTNFKGGSVAELVKAQKCADRMKKSKVSVRLPDLKNIEDCQVWVYTDAAFRNLNNNTDSCGGYVIFLVNIKTGKAAVMEWKANKLKRKVHSTLGAETQILSKGIDAALGVKTQIKEMTNGKTDLVVRAITDNRSARDAIYSESEVEERMLRADIAIIKDMIEDGTILEVRWVEGKDMLADLLTKKGVKKDPLLDVIQSGVIPKRALDLILH